MLHPQNIVTVLFSGLIIEYKITTAQNFSFGRTVRYKIRFKLTEAGVLDFITTCVGTYNF
jgi:hypothetical protein